MGVVSETDRQTNRHTYRHTDAIVVKTFFNKNMFLMFFLFLNVYCFVSQDLYVG